MNKLTIKDIDVKNKKVLIRVDFNVPQDKDFKITDDVRIKAALPTIKYCLDKGASKVILMSHLGRPKGKVVDEYRLTPVALKLAVLLGEPVKKLDDCIGELVKKDIEEASERVVLLENLRFYKEEEKNDAEFAKKLASLGELFINDAFGTAHRAHASTEGVTNYLKSAAGFLLTKEIEYLGGALNNPKKPFVLILGGAKVSDKILLIENMLNKADEIIIGGGMCYTFLKAQGKAIGNSKLEPERLDLAKSLLDKAKEKNIKILLPVDNVVSDKIDGTGKVDAVGENIADGLIGVDIGPKTVDKFCEALRNAATIAWNGPLGIFEVDAFSNGSRKVASFLGNLSAIKIIGGGDTAAMIAKFGLEDKMTHISTGGGASLEYMEGKVLPGIAALSDK
ncbi:MAG: phosphoglycerate kinase [Candidatus Omnitrophica bacterium CG11_big_fil_rev_8_21_14_0_20_42_13]|uniref:Phosphoglycerate kinase n=1 Tax=Candidatus Ghiorseimicrobium undicola TaxID=1974746 RepID=A0A2H0LVH8_9BACT|nr:MAG: phosphoglycerate kinase [Candidatus Omnitrophica bacterium CG11_big_fil_rev_8_21_14_0_20_42_13]